jgi:hypothetical protein
MRTRVLSLLVPGLLWSSIAAAEATIEVAEVRAVFAAGGVDDAAITAAFDARFAAVRGCLDLRKKPRAGGDALVFAAVDKAGRVVRIDAAGLGNAKDESCLKIGLRPAKLPATASGGAIAMKVRVGFVVPPPVDPIAPETPGRRSPTSGPTDLRIGTGKGTPGSPRVEIGEPGTSELSAAAVKKVVAGKKPAAALRACYVDQLAKVPDLAGKIVVRFTIAIDGLVTSSSVTEPMHAAVDECVVGVIAKLKFPANPKSTVVSFPLTFHSN